MKIKDISCLVCARRRRPSLLERKPWPVSGIDLCRTIAGYTCTHPSVWNNYLLFLLPPLLTGNERQFRLSKRIKPSKLCYVCRRGRDRRVIGRVYCRMIVFQFQWTTHMHRCDSSRTLQHENRTTLWAVGASSCQPASFESLVESFGQKH